ncbi:MAG: VUT family protein [Lachnospiraceae bacterium]|nr:VUT family protein [Lachnospiraceae bacterium]
MKNSGSKGLLKEITLLLRSIPSPVVASYIVAIITMNLLANKAVPLPFEYIVLDCGFFLSWMVFMTMDMVTRHFGPRAANLLSVIALLANLFMCGIFFGISKLPGEWSASYVEGSEAVINTALDSTFGGTWYVLMGSSIAFLVSAIVNNFMNYLIGLKAESKKKNFATFAFRSYVSTFIGQFVDNLVFALIVSHTFFGLTLLQCVLCALTGAVMELLCEVIFSPIGYKVSQGWEKDKIGAEYIALYGYGKQKKNDREVA